MSEKIKYTFLEWNVQGAGGYPDYSTPNFVIDTIIEKNVDIIVLVEFYIGCNFDYVRQRMQDYYYIFISPFVYKHNQILIALNRNKFKERDINDIITINPMDKKFPEYLQINIKTEQEKIFSIMGTRIKTNCLREKQFDFLNNKIRLIDKVICIGDFNVTNSHACKYLTSTEIYGPRTLDNARWSFVHKDGGKVGIDLIAVKNIRILQNEKDDLSEKEGYKMYAKYDWDFVNKKNGYERLTSSDYLPEFSGKPNHAILLGSFEV
ncbi:endonuclease/exonuclease/phosphatase family protein [Paraliobacillus ryukyuensis]|uniref:endonuclease/exonuclease/phosphatase family protein n=1 Tax=Paraliobacillus ryukyuensis TaxID=200904 RepID=UPI0009A72C5F|nr:endonuclease/exonuclease/phosphatase family protein [Paraliobacillus ryukyuensis]